MQEQIHTPVLVQEILSWLQPEAGGRYLDATLGLAGHALAIMEQTQGRGEVLGLDQDVQALELAQLRLEQAGCLEQVHLAKVSFSNFQQPLKELGWQRLDGALLDLGLSSLQLDSRERGFSFQYPGPLDMRMDQSQGFTAKRLLHRSSFQEMKRIILEYGQEPMAGRIAKRIVQAREKKEIQNTQELARLVQGAYPGARRRQSRHHPATKTFQALRIAVNQELQELEAFLHKIPEYLRPGARVCVISFHSLEDRLVKRAFKKDQGLLKPLTSGPVQPTSREQEQNPRSRSSRLRAAERI
ncbi:MAG: 16S rRNA (cytosine(1402)-N(4))-methyltransferase RsmH [Thermodesulfobacteriota bacterium]